MNQVFCLKDRLGENKVLEVRRKRRWCNDAVRDVHGWEMCVVDHFCVFTYAGFKSLTIQQCWPPLMCTRVHECTLYCYTFRFVLQFVLLFFCVFNPQMCDSTKKPRTGWERRDPGWILCVALTDAPLIFLHYRQKDQSFKRIKKPGLWQSHGLHICMKAWSGIFKSTSWQIIRIAWVLFSFLLWTLEKHKPYQCQPTCSTTHWVVEVFTLVVNPSWAERQILLLKFIDVN